MFSRRRMLPYIGGQREAAFSLMLVVRRKKNAPLHWVVSRCKNAALHRWSVKGRRSKMCSILYVARCWATTAWRRRHCPFLFHPLLMLDVVLHYPLQPAGGESYNQEAYGLPCRVLRIMGVVVWGISYRIGQIDPLHYSSQRLLIYLHADRIAGRPDQRGQSLRPSTRDPWNRATRTTASHLHHYYKETRVSFHPLLLTTAQKRHSWVARASSDCEPIIAITWLQSKQNSDE